MPQDVEHVESAIALQFSFNRQENVLKGMADTNLGLAVGGYNRENNKMVGFDAAFVPGDCVLVERPAPTTTATERIATESCSRLRPCPLGSYPNISVGREVIRIMEEGIENTVSINGVSRNTNPDRATEQNGERKKNQRDDRRTELEQSSCDPSVSRLYVVDCIIHHL